MAQSLCLLGLPDTQAWTQPVLISNSITQIKAEKYHEIQAVHLEALFASVQYACTVHALCARHSTRFALPSSDTLTDTPTVEIMWTTYR